MTKRILLTILSGLFLVSCSKHQIIEREDTEIVFSLKSRAIVSIQIHSGEGLVRSLVDSRIRREGVQWVMWDGMDDKGRSVEEGEYTAKITAFYLNINKAEPLSDAGVVFNPKGIVVVVEAGDYWYYIADSGNRRVVKLDKLGNIVQQLGSFGLGEEQIAKPVDLALDTELVVSVCDAGNERIQRYDNRGNHISNIKVITKHTGAMEIPEEFKDPQGIAFDGYGNFLISDSGHDRIVCINDAGWLLWETSGYGGGEGQLSDPCGIAVDGEGNIYVADKGNARVVVLNSGGQYIREIESFSIHEESKIILRSPKRLCIGRQGLLIVVDTDLETIVIGDSRGGLLNQIDDLSSPAGVYYKNDILYVAESDKHRISRYRFELKRDEKEFDIEIKD